MEVVVVAIEEKGVLDLNEQSRYREMTIAVLGTIIFFPTSRPLLKIASVPAAVARLLETSMHAGRGSACDNNKGVTTAAHQE